MLFKTGQLIKTFGENRDFIGVYKIHPSLPLSSSLDVSEVASGVVGLITDIYEERSHNGIWLKILFPMNHGWVYQDSVKHL